MSLLAVLNRRQQIEDVFRGANAMAAYVQEHYQH